MTKTPKHEDTNAGGAAPEQQAAQLNELTVMATTTMEHDHAGVMRQLADLKAENDDLKAERERQHNIVVDLHTHLTRMQAPTPTEKVITARNVRKYGE